MVDNPLVGSGETEREAVVEKDEPENQDRSQDEGRIQ